MFVARRQEYWNPLQGFLHFTDTIEEMERWVQDYTADEEDGAKLFVFKVDYAPVMQYTVIREVRGDAWDGTAKP